MLSVSKMPAPENSLKLNASFVLKLGALGVLNLKKLSILVIYDAHKLLKVPASLPA